MSDIRLLIQIAIEPVTPSDREKMAAALAGLAAEDSSFDFSIDDESGRALIKGTSTLHLDIKLDILRRSHKVHVHAGAPQVIYREKIARKVTKDYTHKKQANGNGQFARVKIECEPTAPGADYSFESKIVDGNVPKEYIPGVEKGLLSALSAGVLAGFPVIDLKVSLVDGAYHDIDSSALAFEIASREALRAALREGPSVLLEPIMKVEVVAPDDCVGPVIGDLNSRSGQIQGQAKRGNGNLINAMVPLANLFKYANTLHSMSQGRATFTMQFDHYEPVPLPDPRFRPAIAMRA